MLSMNCVRVEYESRIDEPVGRLSYTVEPVDECGIIIRLR